MPFSIASVSTLRSLVPGALLIALLITLSGQSAIAGPGHNHDHGHEHQPAPALPAPPKAVMSSHQFELVGELNEHGLLWYLDDYASNAPITDATLDIELDGKTARAEPLPDGRYQLHLDQPLAQGEHPLLATILTDTASDLLVGELHIDSEHNEQQPGEQEHSEQSTANSADIRAYIPGLLGLIGLFLLALLWIIRSDRRTQEASA